VLVRKSKPAEEQLWQGAAARSAQSVGAFITAEVARDYGVTDIDDRAIPSLRAERGSPIWRPVVEAGHGR